MPFEAKEAARGSKRELAAHTSVRWRLGSGEGRGRGGLGLSESERPRSVSWSTAVSLCLTISDWK